MADEHRATTVPEDAGPGMNLLQDLRAMPGGMTRPIGVKPEGSKVDRMAAQSAFPALSSAKTLRLSRGSWVNCPSNVDSTAEPNSATARREAMNGI